MKKILILMLFSAILFGCKKESKIQNPKDPFQIEITEEKKDSALPSWHPSEKKICIIFGYGYNEKNYVQSIMEGLSKKYGLDDGSAEGGLLYPLIYPADFPSGRITRLGSLLDERELAGLIIIGAPENTNYAIANLEDEYSQKETMIPYPVYAFFPQDDVAGIEATANFVIDRTLEGHGNDSDASNKEEVLQTQIKDLDRILDNAIEYMLLTEKPLPADSDLLIHVQRIIGKQYKISRYVDPDSGLQSINHFVIEDD